MKKLFIILCITTSAYGLQFLQSDNKSSQQPIQTQSVQEIQKLANIGDVQAQFELANRYHTGNEIEQNDALSFYWYKQVAQKGYANAQFNIANSYYNGKGIEKNIETAIYWYEKASKHNLIPAMYNLGFIFENDKKDLKSAFFWYNNAAELGHGVSQLIIAEFYQKGKGIDKNDELAEKFFNLAIANNVKDSHYKFAEFLSEQQQHTKALTFYEQASKQGSVLADYTLATLYLKSKNSNNKETALELLTRSANAGYSLAQQKLGEIYNTKKDYKQSIFWYKKAANNGNIPSQYSLGVLYLKGLGTQKDIYKSTELFIQAAKNGNADAQYSLAIRYLKGDGIEKNYQEAVKWLERAAQNGHSYAMYSLSLRYKLGQGVTKDKKKRIEWLEKSAQQENKTAIYELSALTVLGEQTMFTSKVALQHLQTFTQDDTFSKGAHYYLGKFYTPSNRALAIKHFTQARTQGHQLATQALHSLQEKQQQKVTTPQQKENKHAIQTPIKTPIATPNNTVKNITNNKKTHTKTAQVVTTDIAPIPNITQRGAINNTITATAVRTQHPAALYKFAIGVLENAQTMEDFITSFQAMQKAAASGFAPAQSDLAMMYLNAMGTPKDLAKAEHFATLAKQNGYLPATQLLIYIRNAQTRPF
jgi:TPR repeat protein